MTLTIGSTLEKRYQIEKKLGEGGFGAVYQARDTRLSVRCAIKESFYTSEEATRQFRREAEMLAKLRHPNLPRVTDYFDTPSGLYLVMDFVEGYDLVTVFQKYGKPLPEDKVVTWIGQVCEALTYLHTQNPPIIHRDIKPQNIIITNEGVAMLVDFGLAKIYESGMNTSTGARGGTPGFSPIEQYGLGSTDARSDIYALGATLYVLLTGKLPPESIQRVANDTALKSPRDFNPQISEPVEQAILHALAIQPKSRPQSVKEFTSEIIKKPVIAQNIISNTIDSADVIKNNKMIIGDMEFLRVPAGKFLMGDDYGGKDEKPQHIVNINYDYWMARFPATNEQYNLYVNASGIQHPLEDWMRKKDHPVLLTWVEAMAYCKWLNNLLKSELPSKLVVRLPTEAEWEKAARGTDGRKYPWGNEFDENHCNIEDGITMPIGLHSPRGDSPYGCADMSGAPFEWTHSLWTSYPYYEAADSREKENAPSRDRVVRGSYLREVKRGDVRCAVRTGFPSDNSQWPMGFRLVVSLETSSLKVSQTDNKEPKPVHVITSPANKIDKINLPRDSATNYKLILSNGMEFMRVQAGKFIMGSEDGDDEEEFLRVLSIRTCIA